MLMVFDHWLLVRITPVVLVFVSYITADAPFIKPSASVHQLDTANVWKIQETYFVNLSFSF